LSDDSSTPDPESSIPRSESLTSSSQTSGRFPSPTVFDPPLDDWPDGGVYQLWVRVHRDVQLTVGGLGQFTLTAGSYVYTGRASRALRARILRHALGSKRKHWHIDYLLAQGETRVERIVLTSQDPEAECEINRKTGRLGKCTVPGFGASDCTRGCEAHLWKM